jgi:hypothetical protein
VAITIKLTKDPPKIGGDKTASGVWGAVQSLLLVRSSSVVREVRKGWIIGRTPRPGATLRPTEPEYW